MRTAPADYWFPAGPLVVRLETTALGAGPLAARLLVSGGTPAISMEGGQAVVPGERIEDHEVLVLERG